MTFNDAYQIAGNIRNCANNIDGIISLLTSAINSVNDRQSGIIPERITTQLTSQKNELENIKADIISAASIVRQYGDTLLNATKRVSNENTKINQRVNNSSLKDPKKLINFEETE